MIPHNAIFLGWGGRCVEKIKLFWNCRGTKGCLKEEEGPLVGFKRNGPGAGSCFNGRRFRNLDGLETERRSNEGLTSFSLFVLANCSMGNGKIGSGNFQTSPRYFSMWEDAMGRDHAAVRSIWRRRLIAFFLFGFSTEPNRGGKVHSYPTNLKATASVNWNSCGSESIICYILFE